MNDMKKESINDELDKLSPLLRDLKRADDGFKTPEGYFDVLEEAVFNRIGRADNRRKPAFETKRGGLFGRFFRTQLMWAAAAMFVLVLAATWLFTNNPSETTAPAGVASQELTEEEIEAYVLENIRDFDAALLADVPDNEQQAPPTKPVSPTEAKPKQNDPIDDLSDEELDLLLKEMSDEELENLIKT